MYWIWTTAEYVVKRTVLDYRQLGVFIQNLILLSLCMCVIYDDNGLTLSIELDSCGGITNHYNILYIVELHSPKRIISSYHIITIDYIFHSILCLSSSSSFIVTIVHNCSQLSSFLSPLSLSPAFITILHLGDITIIPS